MTEFNFDSAFKFFFVFLVQLLFFLWLLFKNYGFFILFLIDIKSVFCKWFERHCLETLSPIKL